MSSETIRPREHADGTGSSTIRTITYDAWRAEIALHGELDIANAPELRAEFALHLDAGRGVLRVDTGAVTFIDSTAIGELVKASGRCREAHGSLILTNAPARLRQLVKIAGLEGVLLIDTAGDAAATTMPD
ncbi:MAG TPA: STAS domain-containing protein [Jatrophihabitans sp.]|nr:STAS domain-containing protein [Jatrophihabitans sp.]